MSNFTGYKSKIITPLSNIQLSLYDKTLFLPGCTKVTQYIKLGNIIPTRGNLVAIIDNWAESFKISFDITLSGNYTSTSWRNLFEVTSGTRYVAGATYPSVFISKDQLIVRNYIGTKYAFYDYGLKLETAKIYHIEIVQKKHLYFGITLCCIRSNSEVQHCWYIKESLVFPKVFVHLSGLHYHPFYEVIGTFANLKIINLTP